MRSFVALIAMTLNASQPQPLIGGFVPMTLFDTMLR
jgi:hypothetical protein